MPNVNVNADNSVTMSTVDGDVVVSLNDNGDVIIGGNGDDVLNGSDGNDKLVGGGGNDTLNGEGGMDLLIGGGDDDILNGGTDDDVLIGGVGFDTYLFEPNSGVDAIMGFDLVEDTIDISATGISDLAGRVTDDANGNAVIDLGDGNQVTVVGVSSADLLASGNFVLAPSGPVEVELGINGTFTDPGDGVDHTITGDVNGESETDTDTFIFGPNNGNDIINDFRFEDAILNPDGTITEVPGDVLDLSCYGIFGEDLGPSGFLAFFDGLVFNGLIESYSVTETDTIINFTADDGGGSLTLLGIGEAEIGIVIELNMVREGGGSC